MPDMKVDKIGAPTIRLRADALREFLDTWETEHGALTPDELARAETGLGLRTGDHRPFFSTSAGAPDLTARPPSSTMARSATRRTSSATCET